MKIISSKKPSVSYEKRNTTKSNIRIKKNRNTDTLKLVLFLTITNTILLGITILFSVDWEGVLEWVQKL